MSSRKTPGLNTQSTADIAFLLLCYFLMVSTMDQQSGLQRLLPPMPTEKQKTEDTKVNKRNIIIVRINSSDRLFAGDQLLDVIIVVEVPKRIIAVTPLGIDQVKYFHNIPFFPKQVAGA